MNTAFLLSLLASFTTLCAACGEDESSEKDDSQSPPTKEAPKTVPGFKTVDTKERANQGGLDLLGGKKWDLPEVTTQGIRVNSFYTFEKDEVTITQTCENFPPVVATSAIVYSYVVETGATYEDPCDPYASSSGQNYVFELQGGSLFETLRGSGQRRYDPVTANTSIYGRWKSSDSSASAEQLLLGDGMLRLYKRCDGILKESATPVTITQRLEFKGGAETSMTFGNLTCSAQISKGIVSYDVTADGSLRIVDQKTEASYLATPRP